MPARPPSPTLLVAALALWAVSPGYAQSVTTRNLLVDYPFDNGEAAAGSEGSEPDPGQVAGAPQAACGVVEGSLVLDGQADYVVFPGEVNRLFGQADFVISLYFHPVGQTPRQTLLARREKCVADAPGFVVDYLAGPRQLEITLAESGDLRTSFTVDLPPDRCWYHLTLERTDNVVAAHVDGERAARVSTSDRIDLRADGVNLELGRAACPQAGGNFAGFVDELRVYRGRLDADERETLSAARPDRIAPLAFPAVNVGDEVTLTIPNTCATGFAWSPAASIVADPASPSPTVGPTENTTYEVEMTYANSTCVARDEVTLQIFGPNSFDCTEVLVPSAFTPDRLGPESNETLFISNGAALQSFEAFEVYDRWGNRVFRTAEADGAWDGTYEGEDAMPGPYLWRAAFACNGESLEATGTTVLIR